MKETGIITICSACGLCEDMAYITTIEDIDICQVCKEKARNEFDSLKYDDAIFEEEWGNDFNDWLVTVYIPTQIETPPQNI